MELFFDWLDCTLKSGRNKDVLSKKFGINKKQSQESFQETKKNKEMKNREKSFERILQPNAEQKLQPSVGCEATQSSQNEQGQQQQTHSLSILAIQATLKKNNHLLLNQPPHHTNLSEAVSSKNEFLNDPIQQQSQSGFLTNCLQLTPKKNTQNAIFVQQIKKQSKKMSKKTVKKPLCYPSSPSTLAISDKVKNTNNNYNKKIAASSQENEFPRFQDLKSLGSQEYKFEAIPKSFQNGENRTGKRPSDRLFDRTQYNRLPLQPFSPNIIDIQSQNQLLSAIKSNPKNEPIEEITYLDNSAQKQQQQQQQQYLFTTPNKHDTQFLRYGSASQQVLGSIPRASFRPKSFGSPDRSPDQINQENQLFKCAYPGDTAIEKRQGRKHNSSSEKKIPREQSQQNYCQSSFVSLPDGHVAEYDCSMNFQGFQTQQEASQLAQSFYSVGTQQFYQTNGQQQFKQGQGINHRNGSIQGNQHRNYNNYHPQLVQCVGNGGDGNIFQNGVGYSSLFLDITQIPSQQHPKENCAQQQQIVYEDNQQLFGQQNIKQTPLSGYPTQNATVGYQFGSYASFGQRSARQQIFPNQMIVVYSSQNSIQNNNSNSHVNYDERQEEFSLDEYQDNLNILDRHSDSENNEGDEDGNESVSEAISSIGSIEGKTEEQQETGRQEITQIREEEQQKLPKFEKEEDEDEEVILNELPKKRRTKGKNMPFYPKQQKSQPPSQPLERKRRVSKKKLDSLSKEDSTEHQGLDSSKPSRNNTNATAARNKYDTKNLVKNFLNQFLSFASSTDPKEQTEVCQVLNVETKSLLSYQEKLRQFLKHRKYNRQLFKEFIHIEQFRELFAYFLSHKAEQWIQNGRMKDKLSHFRALSNFKYISQNHDTVKSWRFRYNFV